MANARFIARSVPRGPVASGYVTKRLAEDWLRTTLEDARRGALPGQVRTGVTFADAAAEWLRYVEHDRQRKPSTLAGYRMIVRSMLLPAFGEEPVEAITTAEIERWSGTLTQSATTVRLARARSIIRPVAGHSTMKRTARIKRWCAVP